jgi:AcrR family transcriptional regulator
MAKKKLPRGSAPAPAREYRGDAKRNQILEQLADQVLATGLNATSLRPLAAAVGTSDRMLLYYFPDKAALITAILGCIVERLQAMLNERVPPGRRVDAPEMVRTLWRLLREPQLRPYMQIWLELAGYASRGEEPHRTIGAAIAGGFLDWIGARLDAPERETREQATTILTQIEGMLLLDAFGIEVSAPRRSTRRR